MKGETIKAIFKTFVILSATILLYSFAAAQKVETVNGARVVHNEKSGRWGAHPQIRIELVRTIGGLDETDPNRAFSVPYDVVRDSAGNIYILDVRDCRIQKIDAEGKFLKSIGRRGQGPGEFQSPFSMDIDGADNLFVFDARGLKIEVLSSDGKPLSTIKFDTYSNHEIRRLKSRQFVKGGSLFLRDLMEGFKKLPKLLSVVDRDGRTQKTFGEATNYKDTNVTSTANSFYFDKDAQENIYLSFWYQNRVEKYASDGTLLWRADRPLNFGTEVIDKGRVERSERGTTIQAPRMNMVSMGIACDGKGRVWVNTFNRQMSPEEQGMSISGGGVTKIAKQAKIEKMDIYKLFIWERANTAVYQYRIVEQ